MTLLHVWSPEPAAADRQARTWSALPAIAAALACPVLSWPTPATAPTAYAEGIRTAWETERHAGGPLLILEGDKEPTPAMAAGLARCPHPVCMQAYRIHPVTTGLPAPVWAAYRRGNGLEWIRPGAEWADWSGLGFLKIGPQILANVPRPARLPFGPDFDRRLLAAIGGGPVHLHWPEMPHHHTGRE